MTSKGSSSSQLPQLHQLHQLHPEPGAQSSSIVPPELTDSPFGNHDASDRHPPEPPPSTGTLPIRRSIESSNSRHAPSHQLAGHSSPSSSDISSLRHLSSAYSAEYIATAAAICLMPWQPRQLCDISSASCYQSLEVL